MGGADIWIKRDDQTGMEWSGNKIRKLEYVVADAISMDCDTIVTEGTSQSNHCRATAAVCARLGLRALLLFRPPPPVDPQGNHLLDLLLGAQCQSYPRDLFFDQREHIVANVMEQLRAMGLRPRFTPMGASEPLGCWGYIRAAAEFEQQLSDAGIGECDVVTALSSGGTYAGLLLGQQLHWPRNRRLWGVAVSDDPDHHRREVASLCESTAVRYDLPVELDPTSFGIVGGYVGDGYAIPYAQALQAIAVLARTEGILLDPVYTGKAFCALLDGVRQGRFGRSCPVVFIHTGGFFSNFAWPRTLLTPAESEGSAE